MAANIECPHCGENVFVVNNIFRPHYVEGVEGIQLCRGSNLVYNAPADLAGLKNVTLLENATTMTENAKALARINMEEAKTPEQIAAALAVSHVISSQSEMIGMLLETNLQIMDKIERLVAEEKGRRNEG